MVERQEPAEEGAGDKEHQVEDADSHGGQVLTLIATLFNGYGTNDRYQGVENQSYPRVWGGQR